MKFYLLCQDLVTKLIFPPTAVEGVARVQEISALGVTHTYSFSLTNHISNVIANCT